MRSDAAERRELGLDARTHLVDLLRGERQVDLQPVEQAAGALVGAPRGLRCTGRARVAHQRFRWPAWLVAQSVIGHHHDIRMFAGDDVDIGGHAGKQLAKRIVGGNDHGVGDHILKSDRCEPDLLDDPIEGHVRMGIDGKADRIVARHMTDIGLIDLRLDLHMIEVLGDGE